MRIWLVHQYAVPPGQAGPTRHYSFARELIGRGHEVTILASSFDHFCHKTGNVQPGAIQKYETVEGVPFLWLRTPPYRGNTVARIWNMLVFAGLVWIGPASKRLSRPDVIVGSLPPMFSAFASERLSHRYGVPFVLEVRDLWPQSLVEFTGIRPENPAIRLLEWIESHLYLRAKRIITLLPGSKEYFRQKGVSEKKVVWIPNGVDLALAPSPNVSSGTDVFTIMYAGNHGLANGLDILIDAAAIVQREVGREEVLFRLVGDGPEKQRLMARAESEGICNLKFDDPVPKKDIYNRLQQADAFLMILREAPVFRWGVSPNKLFDYLVAGRPIIFCANTPYDYVSEAGAGITVPPGDCRALAQAVMDMARMPRSTRSRMGLQGRRYIEGRFTAAQLADKLERCLLNDNAIE